jgi:hypothetical protein
MSIVWWWSPPRRPPRPYPPDDRVPVVPRLTVASWCVLHAAAVADRLTGFLAQAERRLIVAERAGLVRRRRRQALDALGADLDTRSAAALGLIKVPRKGSRARARR